MNGEQYDSRSVPNDSSESRKERSPKKKYLGVYFSCCRAYARIYANRNGTQYVGHCPKCAGRVRFNIGPQGTDQRFFTAK